MLRPQRFNNEPAHRIANSRDAARRRDRIMGGKVATTSETTARLPLFTPASSRDSETSGLRSRRRTIRASRARTWLDRQRQRFSQLLILPRRLELRQRQSRRRLLQETRDLRHLAARHHASIIKNQQRIRVLERSLSGLIVPAPHVSAVAMSGAGSTGFRNGNQTRRITLVAPWYGCSPWPGETSITSPKWWRWLPDHLARSLVDRGYHVEMLTTCVRDPESNWWVNELPIGTEYLDGVLVHRFGVNDDGEKRYHQLATPVENQETIDPKCQAEWMRCGINSEALVQYARQRVVETAVVCIGSIHGLSHDLVHSLDGQVILIAGPIAEPAPVWETSRNILASAGRLLFWSEDDRQLAIQRHGHELGPRLITANVLGPVRDDRNLDAVCRAGSTEDRHQWDCVVDRLVLGVTQSCAS